MDKEQTKKYLDFNLLRISPEFLTYQDKLLPSIPLINFFHNIFNFVFGETPKRVLLQTVKTQMKCSIMLHFIRVYTVCKAKNDFQTKEYIF